MRVVSDVTVLCPLSKIEGVTCEANDGFIPLIDGKLPEADAAYAGFMARLYSPLADFAVWLEANREA